jgi:hypothetical protein
VDKKEKIEKIPDDSPKHSYVVDGATLKCSCGTSYSTLLTPGRRSAKIQGRRQGNIMDFEPMFNILPFGYCMTRESKCVPIITIQWVNGKDDTWVDGAPALLDISKVACLTGGTISIVHDGQGPMLM